MKNGCLDEKTLSSYLDEKPSDSERKKIEGHIAVCNPCLDMLLVAYEARKKRFSILRLWRIARTILTTAIFFERKNRLKQAGLAEKKKKKRPELKWFFGGLFFLVLSFIIRHYFLQFLAISVILGFKWAMEGKGAKRVVMIFKGMKNRELESKEGGTNRVKQFP